MLETAEYYEKCNLTTNPFQQNTVYENDERAGVWLGMKVKKTDCSCLDPSKIR